MKRVSTIVLVAVSALLLADVAAAAQENGHVAGSDASGHVLPLLVAVNAKGEVTRVDPAIDLRLSQQKTLEHAVQAMITAPAKDKKGRGKSSQFVLLLALNAETDDPGIYTLSYASSRPVLPGPAHWASRGHSGYYVASPSAWRGTEDPGARMAMFNNQKFSRQQPADVRHRGGSGR